MNTFRITQGKIELKNLTFTYHRKKQVLNNISLTIRPKSIVAIIGHTGSGKSTISSLIAGLLSAPANQIYIDNQDISLYNQNKIRNHISLVSQENILLHKSILENIKLGNPSASNKEIMAATQKANIYEFITNKTLFPNGLNTIVGERGLALSGGERQRIAIARAFLKNSPIIIFDEATNALDSATEKKIFEAIHSDLKQKTTIIISHRLSTIKLASYIFVIKQGSLVEQGTFNTLFNHNTIFNHLMLT